MEWNDKLVLIDGNSLINRAYFAIPMLNARDGSPTNAVYGFVTMLVKLIETERPKYLAVVFDLRAPTFRHLRYDGYKATRKGMPDDLASQLPKLKELLALMNIKTLSVEGYEADDVIGTIAAREHVPTEIITGDKDALQLVGDTTVVHLTKRGITEIEEYDLAHLRAVYGFDPERIVDLKSLMGDHSDNIPGVPGVGEKTAMKLLADYGSLDGVYEHADELKGSLKERMLSNRESAYLSYELATICRTVPVEYTLEELTYDFPFGLEVRNRFEAFSFRVLAAKDIFGCAAPQEIACEAESVPLRAEALHTLDLSRGYALYDAGDALHLAVDARRDYVLRFGGTLIDPGDSEEDVYAALTGLSDPAVPKTVFDAKQFRHNLARRGIAYGGTEIDAQLAQYVIDSTAPNDSLGAVLDNYGLSAYSAYPAAALVALAARMRPELENFRKVYYEIELPLSDVLFDMEERGMQIDVDVLHEAGRDLLAESERIAGQIHEMAGHPFNIKSPKQVGEVLFDELGLESGKKTKKKTYSTSIEVLEGLLGEHPIVEAILRYRFLTKLYGTYVEGVERLLDRAGVVHTVFKQNVTTTGRLSSVEPNLQNIPVREEEGRLLRKMFVAREGCVYLSADYSQIELRLLAHFSREPALQAAYREGADVHATTASQIFGVPIGEVTAGQRRDAKAVNFGVIYGISEYGLSKNIGISVAKAKKYIQGYFLRYPFVKAYLDGTVAAAREHRKLETPTGRVRKFNNINSSNYQIRMFNERAAMNMPLQGTAADLVKIAMIRVDRALREDGFESRMVCQVHDELILECPVAETERVAVLVKREMEHAMEFDVPLAVQIATGKTWYDLK